MTVQLGSNISALQAQRRLTENTRTLNQSFERLASGLRINRASDDAAGLAIADSLRADTRVYAQGVRNLNDGIALLGIADSALESLSNIVLRLEELASQAANGIYGFAQRKALDSEAQELAREYQRISQSTSFNGRALFRADFDSIALQGGYGTDGQLRSNLGGAIGTGSFSMSQSLSAGGLVHSVSSGDFDGDGNTDIASVDNTSDAIEIWFGHGDGTFLAGQSFLAGTSPGSIVASDLNNDGILDLVVADTLDTTLRTFLGNGNGTFRASQSFGASPQLEVQTADLNNDGWQDILFRTSGTIRASLGRGNGLFGAFTVVASGDPSSIGIIDLNNDGILDLFAGDEDGASFDVYIGNGDGTYVTSSFASLDDVAWTTAGDINNDGNADIMVLDGTRVTSYLGSGAGQFTIGFSHTLGAGARELRLADLNGDGNLDLVASETTGDTIGILLGNGNGSFAQRTSFSVGDGPRNFALSDFNNDGVLDIATGNYNAGSVAVLTGTVGTGVSPLLPFSLENMAAAKQALSQFETKRTQLANQRGTIGALESRIGVAASVLSLTGENYSTAESRIRDADIADETARLTRGRTLQNASALVLAQANLQPRIALDLLEN